MTACLLQQVFAFFFTLSEFQRDSERGSKLASSVIIFCAVINACCTITWSHYSFANFLNNTY